MSEYIVSARKYRPQTFESVVGQKALTQTLKNAISNGRLAHAYLFCGPRGVGKTTCARIFAKTINCLNPNEIGEACNKCESCLAFNENRSFNIHELDAASNNSVEDIRNLIENVQIPPQVGRYSVYIVDEVHMLSNAAFNAFLKTLEEPPAHAIFILATTEKHKIIPTILSRCQIYDFQRIRIDDTIEYLQMVAANEGVDADVEALNIIAQKADGAMRDALSIYDQVVSFCGNKITYEGTIANLNVLDYEYYFKILEMLRNHDVRGAFLLFDEVLRKGFDGQHFITGLASHFRDVLVSKDASTLPLLEVSQSVRQRFQQQAGVCDPRWLFKAIELATDCDMNYRASKNKRLLVETTLIRLAMIGTEGESKKAKSELPDVTIRSAVAVTPTVADVNIKKATAETTVVKTITQPVTTVGRPPVKGIKIGGVMSMNSRPEQELTAQRNEQATAVRVEKTVKALDYTDDNVWKVWKSFAESQVADPYTRQAMLNCPPHLENENLVMIEFINTVQMNNVKAMEVSINQLMQTRFGNPQLTISYSVNENAPRENVFALSPQQKLDRMEKRNPSYKAFKEYMQLEMM